MTGHVMQTSQRYPCPQLFLQDAQEFSKLFLNAVEGALAGDEPGKQSIIQQFCGSYDYVTV